MAGEVSGTKRFLARETATPGTFEAIGGEISSTLTMNNAVVEITNKSDGDFMAIMDQEGLKSATMAQELRLSSDSAFASLLADFDTKTINTYLFGDGTAGKQYSAQITGVTKTSNQAESVTVSLTYQITGTFDAAEA